MAQHYQCEPGGCGDATSEDQIRAYELLLLVYEAIGTSNSYAASMENQFRILDLLEADETYDQETGVARKLKRGTDTVLLEKTVVGSTCVESVSITE